MDAIEKRALDLLTSYYLAAGFKAGDPLAASDANSVAIKAIAAALTPPEGYVLVPVEPTESMQIAAEKANPWLIRYEAPEIWAAMLAARPEVP